MWEKEVKRVRIVTPTTSDIDDSEKGCFILLGKRRVMSRERKWGSKVKKQHAAYVSRLQSSQVHFTRWYVGRLHPLSLGRDKRQAGKTSK